MTMDDEYIRLERMLAKLAEVRASTERVMQELPEIRWHTAKAQRTIAKLIERE